MSKFKFADQLGFSPPIVFEEDVNQDRKGFYRLYIDFEELVKAIEVSKKEKVLKAFNYEDYKSDKEGVFKFEDPESGEVIETIITVNAPFTVEDETGKERDLRLYGRLNKKIANVKTDIFIIRISIEPKKNRVSYALLLIYEGFDRRKNNSSRSDENRVAIEINTYTYEDYKAAIAYLGYRNDQVEEAIIEKFNKAFDLAQKDTEQLTFLYNNAPVFVLEHRDEDKKWQDLDLLLSGFVRNRKERAILRLLRGLAIDESKINAEEGGEKKRQFTRRVDNFFYRLMLGGKGKNTFELLYEKLNDYGIGDPNFTALIQELYKFWLLSSFTDPLYEKNKPYTGGNEVIAYDDKKILGFHTNSYNLDFVTDKSRLKVKVTKDEVVFKEKKYSRRPSKGIEKVDVGVYNLFQPITLMDVPKDSEVKIPTNVIPAFYLKAVHDKNTWSNVDKSIWLGVDVATTLTGIGNLAKLRHLRHLGKLKKLTPLIRVKTAVSVVEAFSGTLNIMLTLADSKSPFAQKLQTYLFWLEMLSLGADVVVEKLLKNSAREALTAIDEVAEVTKDSKKIEELDSIIDHLDEVVELERDILKKLDLKISSKVLTDREFFRIARKIKKAFGVDLKLVDRNNKEFSILFKKWQNDPIYAVFHSKRFLNSRYNEVLDGPAIYFFKGQSPKILMPFEITSYTLQHELYHLRLWHTIEKIYKKQIPRRIHEEYVLSEFVKDIHKWDINDLKNDLDVTNRLRLREKDLDKVDLDYYKNWNLEDELKKINFK